ncbi:MAG: tyrosine--tRNA ligase, partial [Clostridia bacterium]|nr:tyrosine--tRNA ligase [Clostridia bacterium]
RMLTFLPLEQIDEMAQWEGSKLNEAKEILAFELTKLVHGEEEANKAQTAARALFGGGGSNDNMPSTKLADEDFTDGKIDILSILVKTGIAKSRSEGRKLCEQNGVSVDDVKVTDTYTSYTREALAANPIIVKKGKKIFHKVEA